MVDHGVLGKAGALAADHVGPALVGLFDGFRWKDGAGTDRHGRELTRAWQAGGRAHSTCALRCSNSRPRENSRPSATLGLAEQEVAQAQERFRAGVAGNGDVITALLSLNQAPHAAQ
jgi:hypothetical protein